MGPKKKIIWFVNVSFDEVVLQNDLNKRGRVGLQILRIPYQINTSYMWFL